MNNNTFDAIVIGSGISGGWAAKELCEKGLKTLVLERGRNVRHKEDYPTMHTPPWEFPLRGQLSLKVKQENPIVSRCYAFKDDADHFFVKDNEHPYIQDKPFDWIRGYQVGGKSLLWARQVQRWSKYDFEGPGRDGFAVDWPIRYEDIAPWYSYVEHFIGVSGNKDGLDTLPDGEFLPAWEMNKVEKTIQEKVNAAYSDRKFIIGRCAHLTKPAPHHQAQGRGQCMARSLCQRGCPFGAYFSSNSSTLPAAEATGNLSIKPHSVVHSIIYDDAKAKATGVRVIDAETMETTEYYAKVIFVNASALNSNLILLNSKSKRFPNGLGNDNGLLGTHIAFHNYRGTLSAKMDGFMEDYYYGRRPTAIMMPNFRNVKQQEMDFLRGYMTFYSAGRGGWGGARNADFGPGFKEANSEAMPWRVFMMMQGETIPKAENRVYLDEKLKDKWGIPQLRVDVGYDENDDLSLKDFLNQGAEMLEKAGCKDVKQNDSGQAPGLDIHEMGGVRMGKDPETSLLGKYHQMHACPNVYVTDGASMTSTGTQNPSLTYMAFTARAVDHAVKALKRKDL
ncbi:GMC oxidoreductase [Cyclobacterium marinum]|uniref:FAD dependent oxidoreductase n=1 Tax=Cyclobacterium marinum (strain ATCC 25205 / DSM 745 / LMG 13164 / NCIMB 1802) TaxID=880070 RepID=G0J718_CYCMS|nr:GMC family oxidoreductase [Cyclobacterium marinum]AEL26909.1 FAD dependent oxidoreductase [Cyclobacterium marinum DSM 745]